MHLRAPTFGYYLFDSTFNRLFSVCSSSISFFNLPISAPWSLFTVEEEDQVDDVELSAAGEEYHELLLPLLLKPSSALLVVWPYQESLLGEFDQPELVVVDTAATAAGVEFLVVLLLL